MNVYYYNNMHYILIDIQVQVILNYYISYIIYGN